MLLTRRERVELYGKDENDEWIVSKKASPGNLQSFEELLAGACKSSLLSPLVPAPFVHFPLSFCIAVDTAVVLAVKLSANASERVCIDSTKKMRSLLICVLITSIIDCWCSIC
jgi:hypothetical protein